MTKEQENVCLHHFLESTKASGHEDDLIYDHHIGIFHHNHMQFRWLGFRRCWEEHVLTTQATDYVTPSPSPEVECVFVGGPLHGLHMQDPNKPYRLVDDNGEQCLYKRWTMIDKETNQHQHYYKIDCEDVR